MKATASLVLSSVSVGYHERRVIRPVSASLPPGSFTAVLGPNGAGKSTLLKGIAGLLPLISGDLFVEQRPLHQLSAEHKAKTIAYLDQSPACHWPMRVETVVRLGRFPHGKGYQRLDTRGELAVQEALQLTDSQHLRQRVVTELSGGELGRVMLARALAVNAPILLADEPIAGLDPRHQLATMQHLRDWAQKQKIVVAVLHDLTLALRFASHTLLVDEEGGCLFGATREVLTAANIQRIFGVEVIRHEHGGQCFMLPWQLPQAGSSGGGPER